MGVRMTETDQCRLGEGKHRLGPPDEVRLSVTVPERQFSALCKLRVVKGLQKSEVVQIGLNLAFALPPEELSRLIGKLRNGGI
jgi:hypothetical protein